VANLRLPLKNNQRARGKKIFIVPANTFDNVKGKFPIGFKIWNGEINENFDRIISSAYIYEKGEIKRDIDEIFILPKSYITKWIKKGYQKENIGMMNSGRTDFQNQNLVHIQNETNDKGHSIYIDKNNLILTSLFFAIRWVIEATWKNDRRQYEIPTDGWQTDTEFQNDCLAYTLFHGQNRISSKEGINHWIPFTEQEVDAPERFASNFMTDFIKGKIKPTEEEHQKIFNQDNLNLIPSAPLVFSSEAQAVFDAGRELWCYYMKQENSNPNASLYDIREHFQGRNDKGKMNNNSSDETYTQLIGKLREALKVLAEKITTKIFEYGFLRK